MNDSLTIGLL